MEQSSVMDSTGNCGQCNANEIVAVKQKKKKKPPATPTGKSVVVLKRSDVTTRDDIVFMPNTIEMAQLKRPHKGQFKTNVLISSKMTEMDIKKVLVENFPFLEHLRFWCAAAVDNRSRLDFHGERRIWDGRFLKRTIKGNSALYIFTDEDPKVSERSTLKRSNDQITSVESDKLEPPSKRIATTENVTKTTSHTAYSHPLPMGGPTLNVLQQIQRDASKGTSNTDLSLELKKIASGSKGFIISDNQGGGNCMFHVLSEQLYHVKGIKISHQELRHKVVNYLKSNPKLRDGTELFNFVDRYPSWDSYLTNMAADGTWGDHVILHGAANCFKTCIRVISSLSHHKDTIINPESGVTSSNQLVLGHVYELHYVSLIPSTPAQPGMAQKTISTASDQQSLGKPVLPLVPHEMASSTLTSQWGNLNIPKAASTQIQASAGQHHNALRSLDHSKQSATVKTQVRASNRHHEH